MSIEKRGEHQGSWRNCLWDAFLTEETNRGGRERDGTLTFLKVVARCWQVVVQGNPAQLAAQPLPLLYSKFRVNYLILFSTLKHTHLSWSLQQLVDNSSVMEKSRFLNLLSKTYWSYRCQFRKFTLFVSSPPKHFFQSCLSSSNQTCGFSRFSWWRKACRRDPVFYAAPCAAPVHVCAQ